MKNLKVTVFADPVCTWCWGSVPVLRALEFRLADKVEIQVYGRIEAIGTVDSMILFRGARTDRMFDYLPYDRLSAQWGGITLHESSYDNLFVHCDIHSGIYGLRAKGTDVQESKITMRNSQIHNVDEDALQLTQCRASFTNSLFTNAGGHCVNILGGQVSINSKDDGINATATSGTSITIGCETLYIYCNGDCIDSNSRASYAGIVFNSGKCLLITTSGGNSAIDSEQGYAFNGGTVVAVMPKGGMSSESTKCSNFSSIGKSTSIAISKGDYLECTIGSQSLSARMPASISSATVVTLGSSSVSVTKSTTGSAQLEEGEFLWK